MSEIRQPSPAESLITSLVGREFLAELRNYPYNPRANPQSYPPSFMGTIEVITNAAAKDSTLLDRLKSLAHSDRDDPRLRQLVDIAVRGAKPNVIQEIGSFTLPNLGVEAVEEFFEAEVPHLSNDAIVVPPGLKSYFFQEERPTLSRIQVSDGADTSRVYVLIDERKVANGPLRANILVFDGTNYLMSTLIGTKVINGLLSWIDSNAPHSVPSVMKSVALFDRFHKESEDSHGLFDEHNYVNQPLFRVTRSSPPVDAGFTLG